VTFRNGLGFQDVPLAGSGAGLAGGAFQLATVQPGVTGYPDEGYWLKYKGWRFTRYVERKIAQSGRMMTIPNGFLAYARGGLVPFDHPFTEVTAHVTYTHRHLPLSAVPWQTMASYLCAVDPTPFDFTNDMKAAGGYGGTLMYLGADVEQYPGPFGDLLADVRHKMFFSPKWSVTDGTALGHNAALRVMGGNGRVDYETVVSAGDFTSPPFRTTTDGTKAVDFSGLFRPDPPA
jgi:hypothetical protein